MTGVNASPETLSLERRRIWRWLAVAATTLVVASGSAVAHASSLGGTRESMSIPPWLVLMTGGAVIGASFLLVSMVTDRSLIEYVHAWGWSRPLSTRRWLRIVGRSIGLVVLVGIVVVGWFGPQTPTVSLTVLFVWVAWWAGYTMTVYLVGDTWSLVNPWRLVADLVPVSPPLSYPDRLGSWPSLVGLFAMVWLEVTSPIAQEPHLLALAIAVYSVVTVVGAVLFGSDPWFETVDPVSRVFRFYGRVAPIQRTDDGLEFGIPGWRLATSQFIERWDDVAFVLGMLWLTTFDGFVATPTWRAIVDPVVGAGVPALLAYLALMILGFGAFAGAYVSASRYARRWARTTFSRRAIGIRFAQSLLPIAAGYHLAHYLGYFLNLGPSVAVMATQPFSPPAQLPVLVLPPSYGTFQLFFVLIGHAIAIWIAHAIAFDTFTGRLQPIRSQYSYSVVMILFTMTSIAIVYQPTISLPYL